MEWDRAETTHWDCNIERRAFKVDTSLEDRRIYPEWQCLDSRLRGVQLLTCPQWSIRKEKTCGGARPGVLTGSRPAGFPPCRPPRPDPGLWRKKGPSPGVSPDEGPHFRWRLKGKLLLDSGGADQIVHTILAKTRTQQVPWALASIAFIIGIPLFFEVGVVLLIPVVMLVARRASLSPILVGIRRSLVCPRGTGARRRTPAPCWRSTPWAPTSA